MPDRTRVRSDVSPFRLSFRDAEPASVRDPGPATRHARPVAPRHGAAGRSADALTDPHGFTPISASDLPDPRRAPVAPPDLLEAAALAAAFAADYLSWDEDDPQRRGHALAAYLAAPVGDPTRLGWGGVGRQRAEFALPGPVRPDGDGRVLVDVRVRVTPYRAVGDREPDAAEPVDEPEVPGVPAAAPAPTGPGWRGCASSWIRLIVPVTRTSDRLAVGVGEGTRDDGTGADDPLRALRERPVADDDPLAEPRPTPNGAW
jgi:hypothetical protein